MKRAVPLLLGLSALWPRLALAQQACADGPAGQVYSFAAPPPAPAAVRAALAAGRAYLRRGEDRSVECKESARGLPSGYVVATLSRGHVSFSAPEPMPAATLSCLRQIAERLGSVPPAYAPQPPADLPKDLEVQAVWVLRPPESGPAPPPVLPAAPSSRRSFAEIQAEVGRHLPALVSCLAELWEERPHAAGTLVLRLTIAENGTVDEAGVLRREPSMLAAEPCLLRIAGRLRFSPRFGGGRTQMSYPLVLTAAPSE